MNGDTNDDIAIEVSQLRYSYDTCAAVDGVDLTVRRGEIFALLGTNGAGKTTTLELVEGFRRPAAGEIRVLGHDPYRARQLLKPRMGVMLQQAGLLEELTGRRRCGCGARSPAARTTSTTCSTGWSWRTGGTPASNSSPAGRSGDWTSRWPSTAGPS